MEINSTPLCDVLVIETNKLEDTRGSFMRLFCQQALTDILADRNIIQINKSVTTQKGAIRGLHFQYPPHAEIKFVRCLKGAIFDVAVDLRKDSRTFLQWHSEILTPENNKMMAIPEGFAHGFQTLDHDSEVLYLHTAEYQTEFEGGVLFDDPQLNIQWPMVCIDISNRDRQHSLLDAHFTGLSA